MRRQWCQMHDTRSLFLLFIMIAVSVSFVYCQIIKLKSKLEWKIDIQSHVNVIHTLANWWQLETISMRHAEQLKMLFSC